MPMERFSYSREELHAAVWSAPMRDACKRFGVSDVALGKVCRRLNVPRPKQGYWQRHAIGKAEPTVPLPPAAPGAPARWEGQRMTDPEPNATAPAEAAPAPVDPIPVPGALGKLHPALSATMAEIVRVSKDIWTSHRWNGAIPVLASSASLDRGLRIMNALYMALETRGHRVEVTRDSTPGEPWRRGEAGVWVGDMFVGLSLFEHVKKKRRDDSRGFIYAPNGLFTIRIRGNYFAFREWDDTRTKKIEARLHEVIPAVLERAEELRAERIEAVRRHEEYRRERIRQAEAERHRREEEERVERLHDMLARWREVRDIRAFIAEARAIVAAGGHEIQDGSTLDQFIRWAMARMERIDPFNVLWRDAADPTPAGGATPRTATPQMLR